MKLFSSSLLEMPVNGTIISLLRPLPLGTHLGTSSCRYGWTIKTTFPFLTNSLISKEEVMNHIEEFNDRFNNIVSSFLDKFKPSESTLYLYYMTIMNNPYGSS
jgi:hypothetical protein